jgi:cytoskeletal protein CcmA (bactofilin family)
MPAKTKGKALVVCPRCGHQQPEPRTAISSKCGQCGEYLRVQELLNPVAKAEARAPEQRRVACFDCATEQEVPTAAKSAMCKRCSSYIDLQDYTIISAVSKNFRTKGKFVVEPKGYVFNTSVVAREIVVKGQVIGKLAAEQTLTIYGTAEIKGTFDAPLLIVPADNAFHWREPLRVGSVEIRGELVSDIHAQTTVTVRTLGRLFGDVRSRNLVVEEGAVLVGQMNIGAGAGE